MSGPVAPSGSGHSSAPQWPSGSRPVGAGATWGTTSGSTLPGRSLSSVAQTDETSSDLVTLGGGLCVPLPALRLLWSLEDRGFSVSVDAENYLVVSPRFRLTPDDDQAIRHHRHQLIALVRHVEAIQ